MNKILLIILTLFLMIGNADAWPPVGGVGGDINADSLTVKGDVSVSGDGTLLSSEYLQNGDFAVNGGANTTATGWTFTAAGGWNVGTNNMIYTHDANAADQILTQTLANMTIPVVAGKSYALTYEIVAFSDADADGTLRPYIETTNGVVLALDTYLEIVVGTHTLYFQTPASGNLDFIIGVAGSEASDTFTIDNLSLVTTDLIVNGQITTDNLVVKGNISLGIGDGSSVGTMTPASQYTINAYHYSDTRQEHRIMNLWNDDGSDYGFGRGALITMEYSGTHASTSAGNIKGFTGEAKLSGGASVFPAGTFIWAGYNSIRLKNSGIITGDANLYGTGSELIKAGTAVDGTYDSYYGFHSKQGITGGSGNLNIPTMAGLGVETMVDYTGTQDYVGGIHLEDQTIGDTLNFGVAIDDGADCIWMDGLGNGTAFCIDTITLTAGKLKAIATPLSILDSFGAETWIEFIRATLIYDYADAAFAEPSAPDDFLFEYENGTDITATHDATGFLTAGADEVRYSLTTGVYTHDLDVDALIDQNIMILNTGGNYTGGIGTPFVANSVTESTDVITETAHGLSNGDPMSIASTECGITTGVVYWVCEEDAANTFKLDTIKGCGFNADCSACKSPLNLTACSPAQELTPQSVLSIRLEYRIHGLGL